MYPRSGVSRRTFIKAGAGAIAMASTPTGAAAPQPAPERESGRPNILLLMFDQFRGDCLGADGHPCVRTPHLDRIAAEGSRFRCAYSSTPTCTPARAGLLTGMSPWGHGMLGYGRVAPQYPIEMPRALREAGYHTLGIGKMHWYPQRNLHGFHDTILDESGREQSYDFRSDYRAWFLSQAPALDPDATGIGWNEFQAKPYALEERLHPTYWTGSTAVNFLAEYDKPEPFFLKVSFARPHSPYDPPRRLFEMYEHADMPPAVVGDWAARYAERNGPQPDIWHGDLGPEQVRRSRQGYYGSVTFIDEQVGRILDALEKRGMLEDTLVLCTADHGDMTGDHHLWRKSYAYEASARIPMLVRWPSSAEAARGRVSGAPVELRDVLPTFLDAAQSPLRDQCEGKSLFALAKEDTTDWRPWIDLEHDICYDKTNHWNALTDGKWKYIFSAFDGGEQLFHLAEDPHELADLARDSAHEAQLKLWRGRLVEHLSVRGDAFVKNGTLQLRPESNLYGPSFPGGDADLKAKRA